MQATRFMKNTSGVTLGVFGYGIIEPDQVIAVDENFINGNFTEVSKQETKAKPASQPEASKTVTATESNHKKS